MEYQNPPQQPINTNTNNKSLIFLPTIIIVAFLSGLSVYFWQQSSISKLKEELANQRLQIHPLQEEIQNISPTVTQPTPFIDSRILLTPDNIEEYNKPYETACDVKFNYDKPNTTVVYQNSTNGFSVSIPFNPSWGNDKYRINPYDEKNNLISFGYIIPLEACSWTRLNTILVKPAMTVEETQSDLSSNFVIKQTLEKIKLSNGLIGFKYIDEGLSRIYTIEVVGEKYNYKISMWPDLDSVGTEFKSVETIANSIRLID